MLDNLLQVCRLRSREAEMEDLEGQAPSVAGRRDLFEDHPGIYDVRDASDDSRKESEKQGNCIETPTSNEGTAV